MEYNKEEARKVVLKLYPNFNEIKNTTYERSKLQSFISHKKHVEQNPIKTKARRLVFSAIRNKTLEKQPCFCGEEKVEAHHKDYLKPLDVMWLCKEHHYDWHRKHGYF